MRLAVASQSQDEWPNADADFEQISPATASPRAKKTAPPPITGLKSRKLIAFGWYGGKFSHGRAQSRAQVDEARRA
jgi:hypothetical protein